MEKRMVKHDDPNLVGSRVVRGRDWSWGNQDGGEGGVGTIVMRDWGEDDKWISVLWGNGHENRYRVGAMVDGEEVYDLYYFSGEDKSLISTDLSDFFKVK